MSKIKRRLLQLEKYPWCSQLVFDSKCQRRGLIMISTVKENTFMGDIIMTAANWTQVARLTQRRWQPIYNSLHRVRLVD